MSAEGVVGLIAVIVATTAELDWVFRSIAVASGVILWGHLIFRSRRHILARIALFATGTAALLAITWHPIWEDFHQKHPEIATSALIELVAATMAGATDFLKQSGAIWALAVVAFMILVWGWRPFWGLRHRVASAWRTLLGEEENWVGREDALKIIRASDWAALKAPPVDINIAASLARAFGGATADREELEFKVYLDLTLDNFERDNPSCVRQQEGKKEYLEQKLILFLRKDSEDAIIKKFGPVPTGQV
jgi:hypothetical protein